MSQIEKRTTLSLTADLLTDSDLDHDVLYFEPFRTNAIREASQLLISECQKDAHKRDVFKYNMTELFKKHYGSIVNQKLKPNTALLEKITMEILNNSANQTSDDFQSSWSDTDKKILKNIPMVERWYKEHPHMIEKECIEMVQARCYIVMHIASYVLEEHEMKQIQLSVPTVTNEKFVKQKFLEYEILLLRFLKMLTSKQQSSIVRYFPEFETSFNQLIDHFNRNFVHIDKPDTRQGCVESAKLLLQCYWILMSKFATNNDKADWCHFKLLEKVKSLDVLLPVIQFWTKFPIVPTTSGNGQFYCQLIVYFILRQYSEIPSEVINHLIREQRLGQHGMISKTFALFHVLKNDAVDAINLILQFPDTHIFPNLYQSLTDLIESALETNSSSQFPLDKFEFMWQDIINSSFTKPQRSKHKILIQGIISDLESYIISEYKKLNYLSEKCFLQTPRLTYFQAILEIIQKYKKKDAIANGFSNEGYKLIANIQSQNFSHFVNLSPQEAESCFKQVLEILMDIPELENLKMPFEVLSVCFQNACLHRDFRLRNYMAGKIVCMLQGMHNYHAMNHFLWLIAKILRSQSSEDLLRKNKRSLAKDFLINGVHGIIQDLKTLDSEIHCQVHLTCVSIITFCDQTHVFDPLRYWFENLNQIVRTPEKAIMEIYINLICKQVLNVSSRFPIPRGKLIEIIRDRTSLFLLLNHNEHDLAAEFCKNDVDQLVEKNINNIHFEESLLCNFLVERLKESMESGLLVSHLVNATLTNFNCLEVQKNCIPLLQKSISSLWNYPVQHEDMEYITHVTSHQKFALNVYFQFKLRDELDGSEIITVTVGNIVFTLKFACDFESLNCFYTTNNGDQIFENRQGPHGVHTVMMQISCQGDEISIITPRKTYQTLNRRNTRPVDEIKVTVTSLHHTIPVIFQGDTQSLTDFHELAITPRILERSRRLTLISKGRKLNIGQMFHTVIPVRHNQLLSMKSRYIGFESSVDQLRSAGGFGFIFYNFTKNLIQNGITDDLLAISQWELLLAYLSSPCNEKEKFSRTEALQMTSLLLRYTGRNIPEIILQKLLDKCMIANQEIKEAVLLTELLSEHAYWETDLHMFYRLLVRFKSTKPGSSLEKFLPLVLQIVAKIIRADQGTDDVHDIVTVTVEIFKEWCREPHAIRTAQLVTFMMDLFDFERITAQNEKFRWVDETALERELSRQPLLSLNGDEEEAITKRRINRELLQLDLPLGNIDDDELFRVLTPTDELPSDRDIRMMTKNRDYMMKGLLQIIHQAYVLCPDTEYACFDSITAEKICYLIEVNNNEKVVGSLIWMYEAIINHNIYSDKITKIVQLNLLLILARQLRNKPINMKSVNALFSILLREQVDVSAGLDNAHLENFSPNTISCQAVYPLLTIFEESADDIEIAVFTVVCTSLNKVYIYNNQLTQAMTAAGIDEHLTAILAKLSKLGDFRIRNEKLKALLDPWFAFAISVIRIGVNGRQSVFDGASRLVSHVLFLYTQENGKLLDHPESESQRLIRDNIYWALCVLLLQLFKFLLDIALADSNKHRSASNSSLHMLGYDEEPEEIDAAPPKPTKFWDDIAQKVKESVLGPNHNLLKCPYRKHKESPLTAEEIRHRIKDVLTLCQYFFKVTNRVECDEEESLYRIFFEELSKWALEEAWPNCIWIAADMMFITNIFANCVTFALTDIHQYIIPFNKVFVRQKTSRIEILLHRIIRSYTKISTVFGNVMDIDQMIKLTMENITQREDPNSNVFKLAVLLLSSPARDKAKGNIEYPQPQTPDLIQKITVESEIASRYWLDQRNEVIQKINLKGRVPQYHFETSDINNSLEKMQKTLAAPRNMKRVNEICELILKLEDNERVFSRLTLVKNQYRPRKITTKLGPKGERMITDYTDVKTGDMFVKHNDIQKISQFREVFDALSLSWIRKPSIFATLRNACIHGVLLSNGVQTNPIFHVHRGGITALPCGSHLIEKTYWYQDITMIFRRPMRPWDALEVSFEILLKTHETILIFTQQRFAKLLGQYASKLIASDHQLMAITKQWEDGKTSNFEYLMMLNLFAGRTFHDTSNYPIFPRIMATFGNDSIDLQDKTIYRKLDRPVAAQDLLCVEKHKQHYNELKENEEVSHLSPYHYGSMCSNRGVVSFFNIRLLPFGEEAIELQDGRFDFPDRLFYNIESGLGLGKIESGNDYKELVPELFTTVEILRNENRNDFGERQNGETVNDVEVPKWCFVDGHPIHENFIYLHRQALESEHVQATLHNWIDLIFGYKSRGKAAHDAINVYHPAVYPGNSAPIHFDRVMMNAYEANQKTLGTAPLQLFTQAHPKREVVQHRHGSVRNMHGLAFGKELTVGQYEVSEYSLDRQSTQRVWRRMKSLKSKIFNKSYPTDHESVQLFKKNKDRKEKDPADMSVKIEENTLIISDGLVNSKKDHTKKISEVSVDDQYIACLIHEGPIEIYKMMFKNTLRTRIAVDRVLRGDNKHISIEYYGTLPVQEGHFTSVEVCMSFTTIFTIQKVGNSSKISVWDLHSHHIRGQCSIERVMESCGVLKNLGELIMVEKWNGEQVKYEKQWRTKDRISKKKKYTGKLGLVVTTQLMSKVTINAKSLTSTYYSHNQFIHNGVLSMPPEPGMGIQTLAMIRQDHAIVLFETLGLTLMRILEVENRMDYCLRELRFQEDNSLIAIFKESRTLQKKNKKLYENLGCAPPSKTWRFKVK